jgi:hypothetical protein
MPRETLPLTDKRIQNAKPVPGRRITSLFDGGGLYLEIHADGIKRWRMKYRHDGKERLLAFAFTRRSRSGMPANGVRLSAKR